MEWRDVPKSFETASIAATSACVRSQGLVVLGRWGSAEQLERLCRLVGHSRLNLTECDAESLFPGFSELSVAVSDCREAAGRRRQSIKSSWRRSPWPSAPVRYSRAAVLEVSRRDCWRKPAREQRDPRYRQGASMAKPIWRAVSCGTWHRRRGIAGLPAMPAVRPRLPGRRSRARGSSARHSDPAAAAGGVFVWHDCADWGWMSEWNPSAGSAG